jgi:hypothetical protein
MNKKRRATRLSEVLAEESREDGGLKTEHSVRRAPNGTLIRCTWTTVTQRMAADDVEAANRRARAHTASMAARLESGSRRVTAPSRPRGYSRAPRAASPRRRGSRRSTSGGGDPGDPDGDSDPDADDPGPQGIGDTAGNAKSRRCRVCGQPCKRGERTCARCRKDRQRKGGEARKLEAEPRQATRISAAEVARIGDRDREIELLEKLMRAAPGAVYASGAVIA